ncbi:MAG: TetR/AcrR family transcriptional regulator [Oscillospiraceae bacterium]
MPASRSEKAAATRKKLIETARKAFSENGYKGASVRNISKSINVSESLLYHYFPNGKRELFAEIMKDEFFAFRQKIPREAAADAFDDMPVQDALECMLSQLMDFVKEHIDILRIIILEKEVREFLHAEDMCRFMDEVDSFFEKFLQNRIDKGEIGIVDTQTASLMLKGFLLNSVLFCILGVDVSDEISAEKRKEAILRFLNKGKEV